jgi:hypothetical protein
MNKMSISNTFSHQVAPENHEVKSLRRTQSQTVLICIWRSFRTIEILSECLEYRHNIQFLKWHKCSLGWQLERLGLSCSGGWPVSSYSFHSNKISKAVSSKAF